MFDLIDRPVDDTTYQQATIADHGPDGLFLQQVVLRKMIGDDIWRFNSDTRPYVIEQYHHGNKIEHPIQADVAVEVSRTFGIAVSLVAAAFDAKAQRIYLER